jgi:phage baseplate assembly protein W
MPTFIGFNTINQVKKFTIVDFDLIKRDLLNAFNIPQGTLPGRPGYGTTLWSFIFENQTVEVEQAIVKEVQRVAGGDPRLFVSDIELYPMLNGIRIEISLTTVGSTSAERLAVFFDEQQRQASYV